MIFDFHLHLTLKPFNSVTIHSQKSHTPDDDLWNERFRPKKNISHYASITKEVNTTSQAHLNAVAKAGIRCVCTSLYPLERVFTQAFRDLDKSVFFPLVLFLADKHNILPLIAKIGTGPFIKLVGTLNGFEPLILKDIRDGRYHYYKKLKDEYNYLISNQKLSPSKAEISYEMAKDFGAVQRITAEGKLAVIHTVEGSNCFLDETNRFETHLVNEKQGQVTDIINLLKAHIGEFKELEFPPFIITLAHHQYNFICGHAPSFTGITRIFLKQEGKTTVENQSQRIDFFDVGIRSWGFEILELILSRSVGKGRTLIDTKHMSAQARVDYHTFIKRKKLQGDAIPILQTHTGVNGRPTMTDALGDALELTKEEIEKSPFFTGSINLFDDEIQDILESDGLIGIMLDEKRILGRTLPGDAAILAAQLKAEPVVPSTPESVKLQLRENQKPENRFNYHKRLLKGKQYTMVKTRHNLEIAKKETILNPGKVRRLENKIRKLNKEIDPLRKNLELVSFAILLNQYFYIVQTGGAKAWDHVCLGSDYEGVIDPLDIFYYADSLENIKERLSNFWEECLQNEDPVFNKYRALRFDLTVEHIVEKIFWGNAERFLRKYFNDGYRRSVL